MDIFEITRAYNECERKNNNAASGEVVVTPELIKFISHEACGSYISFFNFHHSKADETIKREMQYFKSAGSNFEWKVYDTDSPSNLGFDLLRHGFIKAEAESLMVLDLTSVKVPAPQQTVVEVKDEQGIRDVVDVQQAVWGGDFEWLYYHLLQLKSKSPDSVSIYIVYVDNKPVTSAWLTFTPDSPFAGIWGGSTLKEYRGRGFYTLLLEKRIAEAKLRGRKYLFIEASDMSRPIVAKHGFNFITNTTGYHWNF